MIDWYNKDQGGRTPTIFSEFSQGGKTLDPPRWSTENLVKSINTTRLLEKQLEERSHYTIDPRSSKTLLQNRQKVDKAAQKRKANALKPDKPLQLEQFQQQTIEAGAGDQEEESGTPTQSKKGKTLFDDIGQTKSKVTTTTTI